VVLLLYCLKDNLDILELKYQNGEVLNRKPQSLSLNKNVKYYLLKNNIFTKKIPEKRTKNLSKTKIQYLQILYREKVTIR
jgi:hypothetical protein